MLFLGVVCDQGLCRVDAHVFTMTWIGCWLHGVLWLRCRGGQSQQRCVPCRFWQELRDTQGEIPPLQVNCFVSLKAWFCCVLCVHVYTVACIVNILSYWLCKVLVLLCICSLLLVLTFSVTGCVRSWFCCVYVPVLLTFSVTGCESWFCCALYVHVSITACIAVLTCIVSITACIAVLTW